MERDSLVTAVCVALAVGAWLVAAQLTDSDLVLWAVLFGIGLGGPALYRYAARGTENAA
ncbi:hypothetical protein GCM10009037_05360 [Halarchaeum grantii]|uniref:Uncharacterized protein n=1 Tax=Halarchaeum grantii TaxID=1193105 RepID=A0A830EZE6_9EURY|nr:hypothetical protein [Halarchaeum grantii]GGL24746.1 hypothetical protein GCM10009037_05360 [Halarchaeum grantii]